MRGATDPSIEEAAQDIRSMRVRGAAEIGRVAAAALAHHLAKTQGAADALRKEALRAARLLDGARPSAVSLHNALGKVLEAVAGETEPRAMREAAAVAAQTFAREAAHARDAIVRHGAGLLADRGTVLTHCHSSTAVALLQAAHAAGPGLRVIATETRPFRQGFVTARALAEAKVPVTLVVDSAAGHAMESEHVRAVVVGADTVTAGGTLVNKVGTHTVAILARELGIPFYCAAGFHKFTRRRVEEVPIEMRGPEEVVGAEPLPPAVGVLNPVFDRTPPDLVDRYITPAGAVSSHEAVRAALPHVPPEEVWG